MRFPALKFCLFLIFSLVTISLLSLKANSAQAQATTTTTVGSAPSNSRFAPELNPDVPKDQHIYIQSVVIELMSSVVCQLTGYDPIKSDQKCLGVDPNTGKLGFVDNGGGAIGAIGTFISYTYTPPVSSGDYVRYLSGNFGISKNAYAQELYASQCASSPRNENGFGFCGIRPLLDIWIAMRNIAYLLFVIIFVLIGLAIMFRVHIDPRTVMTIENQIPKIIVGILLVTFSFAFAGLLIDIMYVSIYLVGGVLVTSFPAAFTGDISLGHVATSPTPFDAINRLWPGGFLELGVQGGQTMGQLIESALGGGVNPDMSFGALISNTIGFFVGIIIGVISAFIISLALIYTAIRLWIILVVAYISILLDIIFAPFWFLVGLFPGSTTGVGAWFKDMLANLAVFPTALAMFILGRIFSTIAGPVLGSDPVAGVPVAANPGLFIPPLVGGGAGAGSDVFAGIIALGFLFMTPHVLQITRGAIKAPNINYGPVFQPVGAAGGAIKGGAELAHTATHDPMDMTSPHRTRGRVLGKLFGM